MKTLIIIITHANTASAFVDAVKNMSIEMDAASLLAYDIKNTNQPKEICQRILSDIHNKNNSNNSVLFITDLIGSTPYNIAKQACEDYAKTNTHQSALITGLNLPMLLKALTYQDLPAKELAEKSCATGCDCIIYQSESEPKSKPE